MANPNATITTMDNDRFAGLIAGYWIRVAAELGLEGEDISDIQRSSTYPNERDKAFQVLEVLRDRECTYEQLAQALQKLKKGGHAKQVLPPQPPPNEKGDSKNGTSHGKTNCEKVPPEIIPHGPEALDTFQKAPGGGKAQTTDKTDGAAAPEMCIAFPSDVISFLDLPVDIAVQKMTESLGLDEAALRQPTAETKRTLRGLADLLVKRGRVAVLQKLREVVPSGTTGPLMSATLPVCNMPYETRKNLTIHLSGGDEWKVLADKLGLSAAKIRFFDKRIQNPGDELLEELREMNPGCTVGFLYDALVECGMPSIADIM